MFNLFILDYFGLFSFGFRLCVHLDLTSKSVDRQQILIEEVQYLLDNDFIELSQSEWSSPYFLVPNPDGLFCMCTDYRKVNPVTKISHPTNG